MNSRQLLSHKKVTTTSVTNAYNTSYNTNARTLINRSTSDPPKSNTCVSPCPAKSRRSNDCDARLKLSRPSWKLNNPLRTLHRWSSPPRSNPPTYSLSYLHKVSEWHFLKKPSERTICKMCLSIHLVNLKDLKFWASD